MSEIKCETCPPNVNCLYPEHQPKPEAYLLGETVLTVNKIKQIAAEYIDDHPTEFEALITFIKIPISIKTAKDQDAHTRSEIAKAIRAELSYTPEIYRKLYEAMERLAKRLEGK